MIESHHIMVYRSSNHSICTNLDSLIGFPLPRRGQSNSNEAASHFVDDNACAICYTYALAMDGPVNEDIDEEIQTNDSFGRGSSEADTMKSYVKSFTTNNETVRYHYPDIVCNSKNCHRAYHRNCIIQWIQSDSTSKCLYGVIYGTCPYCYEQILIKK
jgi:hypothetical protein